MAILYKIINRVNRKWYVGSSTNKARLRTHLHMLRHNKHENIRLQNSWNKHGEANFTFKVFCEYPTREEAANAEQKILNKHFGKEYCYNLSPDAWGYNHGPLKEETKRKISESLKGRPAKNKGIIESNELREKRGVSMRKYFATLTPEQKSKIYSSRTGTKKSQSEIEAIRKKHLGKIVSDETKAKMKLSKSTPEAKLKLHQWKIDMKRDFPEKWEEYRAKIRVAMKAGWETRRKNSLNKLNIGLNTIQPVSSN